MASRRCRCARLDAQYVVPHSKSTRERLEHGRRVGRVADRALQRSSRKNIPRRQPYSTFRFGMELASITQLIESFVWLHSVLHGRSGRSCPPPPNLDNGRKGHRQTRLVLESGSCARHARGRARWEVAAYNGALEFVQTSLLGHECACVAVAPLDRTTTRLAHLPASHRCDDAGSSRDAQDSTTSAQRLGYASPDATREEENPR